MVQQPKNNIVTAIFQRPLSLFVLFIACILFAVSVPVLHSVARKPVVIHKNPLALRQKPEDHSSSIVEQENLHVNIMPLGDSITFGVGSTSEGGYRVTLWKDIELMHLHVAFSGSRDSGPAALPDRANEGHPGWRIDQISDHVVMWLRKYKPQIILLHIGTNDIIHNYKVSSAPERLQHLLMQITTTLPHTTVIVAQIIPLGRPELDKEVVTYNRAIPGIVHTLSAEGKQVEYVNMYNAVPVKDLPDRIHPNDQGYRFMASVWFEAVRSVMEFHQPWLTS